MNLALRGLLVGICWGICRAASRAVMSRDPGGEQTNLASQTQHLCTDILLCLRVVHTLVWAVDIIW